MCCDLRDTTELHNKSAKIENTSETKKKSASAITTNNCGIEF
jgi:hypothetical protein